MCVTSREQARLVQAHVNLPIGMTFEYLFLNMENKEESQQKLIQDLNIRNQEHKHFWDITWPHLLQNGWRLVRIH